MTGERVRELRLSLGMSTRSFAALVGVHITSVQRWEGMGPAETRADIGAARILEALERACASSGVAVVGQELCRALAQRGELYALFRLLALVFPLPTALEPAGQGLTPEDVLPY